MPAFRLTPVADRDLSAIARYIAVSNPVAAHAWLEEMHETFRLLGSNPEMGQLLQNDRFEQLRAHSRGNYVIFYQPMTDGIEVLRVLHGARRHDRLI